MNKPVSSTLLFCALDPSASQHHLHCDLMIEGCIFSCNSFSLLEHFKQNGDLVLLMDIVFGAILMLQAVCTEAADFSQYDVETTTDLNLSNGSITAIEGIGKLVKLRTLNFSNNCIKEIPSEIGELRELRELYIEKNALEKIPPEIGNLTNLEILYAEENNIECLPDEMGRLTKMKKLDFSKNYLKHLPASMLSYIHLELMDLEDNEIVEFGDVINTIGCWNLKQRYGDSVLLSDDTVAFEPEDHSGISWLKEGEEISVESVYKELMHARLAR